MVVVAVGAEATTTPRDPSQSWVESVGEFGKVRVGGRRSRRSRTRASASSRHLDFIQGEETSVHTRLAVGERLAYAPRDVASSR